MELGEFICQRLVEVGIEVCFGVPGDFSLGFLNSLVQSKIKFIGTCNELNAAYAADGYARLKGMGAVCTTYAVGELSALNGVAGAFAENIPIIMLVGVPARKFFITEPLLHHTLGDYMIPMTAYENFTCAQTLLNDPETAAYEVDRVLKECWLCKRPVYIGIPSDMVNMTLTKPTFNWETPPLPLSEREALDEVGNLILERLRQSSKPILVPGVELLRRNLQSYFWDFHKQTCVPYTTMLLSKGIFDEKNNPGFIGLYSGERSEPKVLNYIHKSDLQIIFGEKMTDFNTGGFTTIFGELTTIYVNYNNVKIGQLTFYNVYIHDLLKLLVEKSGKTKEPYKFQTTSEQENCLKENVSPLLPVVIEDEETGPLTMYRFFFELSQFMKEKVVLIAETGSSLFSAAELVLPKDSIFIGQTFYGSIGYTVGACLGVCAALKEGEKKDVDRDIILLVGDGSFQVTAQELSTIIRHKYNPFVFVINNDGYLIERVIYDNIYNDIQMWRYAEIPKVFGATGCCSRKINTVDDLKKFLSRRKCLEEPSFGEIVLERWDCNELLKKAGATMAENNFLKKN